MHPFCWSIATHSRAACHTQLALLVALLHVLTGCALERPAEPAASSEFLAVDGVSNFRDLGGYQTADGFVVQTQRIYRSGDLARLTPGGQSALMELGIQQIIDLRSAEERERAPARSFGERQLPPVMLLPIGGSAADWSSELSLKLRQGGFSEQELREIFVSMYATVPLENSAEYARLVDAIIAANGQPILFHCTAGKDRTGIGAALILAALGVPREQIMQDFMASNTTVDVAKMSVMLAKILAAQSGTEVAADAIRPMLLVEPIYLDTAFAAIEAQYGSLDRYLTDALLIDTQKRGLLREILLVRAP